MDGALATLKDGERLFRFSPEADCRLVAVEIDSPLLSPSAAQGPSQDQHAAEQQASRHEGEAHGHEDHTDLDITYRFECADPERLRQVEVGVFHAFPATHLLEVQSVGPSGQAVTELSGTDAVFELR